MKRVMASLLLLSWACVSLMAQDALLNPFKTGNDAQLRGRIVLYDWFRMITPRAMNSLSRRQIQPSPLLE